MIAKRTPRLAAAFAAAALALGIIATGGTAAQAAPTPGTGSGGGTLTLTPASGVNTDFPQFTTSGACPATADAYDVHVTGPSGPLATGTHYVVTNTSTGFSSSAAFITNASEAGMLDLQHDLAGASSVNPAGEYDFTLECIDSFDFSVKATFTGAAYYGTARTYTATASGPNVTSAAKATGTAKVGSTLTCAASFGNAGSVAYSWLKNGSAIGGATTSKLAVPASLVNQSVSCKATAANVFGTVVSTSSAHKIAIGSKATVKKKPSISGTAKAKKTLTCNPGTWSLAKPTYSYQWKRAGKAISGSKAKKAKYKVVKKDKGKSLTCTVTVKKTGYASATATTKAKKVSKTK